MISALHLKTVNLGHYNMDKKTSDLFSDDIGSSSTKNPLPIEERFYFKFYCGLRNYAVGASSGIVFYAPIMALSEFASGMTSDEIGKSRLLAACFHSVFMRPIGKFRNIGHTNGEWIIQAIT